MISVSKAIVFGLIISNRHLPPIALLMCRKSRYRKRERAKDTTYTDDRASFVTAEQTLAESGWAYCVGGAAAVGTVCEYLRGSGPQSGRSCRRAE